MRARPLLLAAVLVAGALGAWSLAGSAQGEEEGGEIIELPLFVAFDEPANGTALVDPHVRAVIRAGGATATFVQDDFAHGTAVNATVDETGVHANVSSPTSESYYLSRVFEFPAPGAFEWSEPLDILLGGGTVGTLVNVSVRFGDQTPGRNWSAWYEVGVAGVFDAIHAANASLVDMPAMQYRVDFPDPANASTPYVTFVEVWYLSPAREVSFRVGQGSNWQALGQGEGQYMVNVTLLPGPNDLQARVVDSAGRALVATVWVSFDTVRPAIASAPAEGSVIPADGAAEIVFSEPVDQASAAAAITVSAPFEVDRVWSADGTRLFLSAAGAPSQATVTVTVGPGLVDRAGNRFNDSKTYHYTMGSAPETAPISPLLVVLLLAGASLGAVAFWHAGRLKEQRRQYAENFRMGRANDSPAGARAGTDGQDLGGAENERRKT